MTLSFLSLSLLSTQLFRLTWIRDGRKIRPLIKFHGERSGREAECAGFTTDTGRSTQFYMADSVEDIISRLRAKYRGRQREHADTSLSFEEITERGRSQVVSIGIEKRSHDGVDLSRFVCQSTIGVLSRRINLEAVLRRNLSFDIGTIAVEDRPTRKTNLRAPHLVFRATHLVATADYTEIEELVVKTALYADQIEEEFFASDQE